MVGFDVILYLDPLFLSCSPWLPSLDCCFDYDRHLLYLKMVDRWSVIEIGRVILFILGKKGW